MSGPLTNLKKTKKSPFVNGNRNVPFRPSEYTADENKLLDEITTNVASSRIKEVRSSIDHKSPFATKSKGAPGDPELMTLMMSRLTQLEQKVQYQAKEIQERDKRIRVLDEKVKLLQQTKGGGADSYGKIQELEKRCLLYQQQIHEMEDFLSDYGMVWVGETSNPHSAVYNDEDDDIDDVEDEQTSSLMDVGRTWTPAASVPKKLEVDYNRIIENLNELNALAGEGQSHVHHTSDGARLRQQDSVPITLYANGIFMFNGPFRPFEDPETQACVTDLTDGFFPSELQDRYPDGVPFVVTDKREKFFKDKYSDVFSGSGQALGGETGPSRLVPTNINKSTNTAAEEREIETEADRQGPKMSMEQFLGRLPKSVVKQGKVIDIRNQVENQLDGGTKAKVDVTVVETEAVKEMKARLEIAEDKRPPSSKNLTTLRVKSETGDHTWIVKMKFKDKIGDLRYHLQKERSKYAPPFEICSAFPNRVYNNDTEMLYDCGLTPNATLHLRIKKK